MKKSKIIITACMISLAMTACSTNEPKSENLKKETSATPKPETGSASETTDKTETKNTSNTKDKAEKLAVGTKATLNDWEFTVSNMQISDSISSNEYSAFTPTEGNKFIQIFVSVTNNGQSAHTFLPSFQTTKEVSVSLLHGDGEVFSSSKLLAYANELYDSSLEPLASVDKEITFQVPESVSSAADELLIVFSAGNDSVKYKVR